MKWPLLFVISLALQVVRTPVGFKRRHIGRLRHRVRAKQNWLTPTSSLATKKDSAEPLKAG